MTYGVVITSDEQAMQLALDLAREAFAAGEVPVGAVLVQNEQVIGAGYNSPIERLDPSAHAEMLAIRDAGQRIGNYRLTGATLYVTVEPCSMCAGAIVHSRIQRVVFGALEPKAGALCSAANFFESEFLNHRPVFQGGVLAEECSQLMTDFFSLRRAAKKALKRSL